MRSFFNKPAWAVTGEEPNAPEFYRRSKQTYNDIIAANRQQYRDAVAKSTSQADRDFDKSLKRRRISQENVTSTAHSFTADPSDCDAAQENEANEGMCNFESKSSGPMEAEQNPIVFASDLPRNLLDTPLPSTKENNTSSTPYREKSKSPSNPNDCVLSAQKGASSSDKIQTNTKFQSHPRIHDDHIGRATPFQSHKTVHSTDSTESRVSDSDDEIVQILITSEIKDTKPLVVQRRMSQRFRDVRLAWCGRQKFDEKMTSSVYLTWNKRRLFDVTTCKSLGLSVRLSHMPTDLQSEDESSSQNGTTRIHVEAVTDELLRSQAESANHSPDATDVEKETVFNIVLRSQNNQELLMKVRGRTKISQVVKDFRVRANVAQERSIHLCFDGDILDPESRLEEHDITDHDLIEPRCRASQSSSALHFRDAELEQQEVDFNPTFVQNILPRLDWERLRVTAQELGFPTISDTKPDGTDIDETTLRDLHRLLLEIQVVEGKLCCETCGHEYEIKEGIANFLLPSHLGMGSSFLPIHSL
ncbi:hypothetical protein BGW36DRAFT_274281, partial [Talaromyces proteolyticus]